MVGKLKRTRPNSAAENTTKSNSNEASQAKQPSRKGKKAWRKNIDISGIEEKLDDMRAEERMTGGIKLSAQQDDKLFTIDKTGNEKAKQSLKAQPLRIDQIINMKSGIPGLTSRHHPVSSNVKEIKLDNGKTRKISKSTMQSIEKLKKRKATNTTVNEKASNKKDTIVKDPWANNDESLVPIENEYLEVVKPKKVKKPKLNDRNAVEAVSMFDIPAGISYNPSFVEHQDLVKKAVSEEEEIAKKRAQIQSQLSYPKELDDLASIDVDVIHFEQDEEMDFDHSDDEVPENEETIESCENVKETSRKTKTERNKELRRKQKEREESMEKNQKAILKQINSLNKIVKEIDHAEKKPKVAPKPKTAAEVRLGPHKFKPIPLALDVPLSEDLSDSLLKLKPEGNLFLDKFKSMESRGLIEPRVPVGKRRRYKVKEIEVHSYKRFS